MAEDVTYEGGNKLQAGKITTDQIPVAADTYYDGMLLEYQSAGTPVTAGTGDGVASAVTAAAGVLIGAWVLTFTAALVADLTDPNGTVIEQDITITDGGAATFTIAGLTFTVTDGSTAFIATDTITMTIAAGVYLALANGMLGAIYNGVDAKVYASAGVSDAIMGGEISEDGLVDTAGAALTITEADRAAYSSAGFYIKRT